MTLRNTVRAPEAYTPDCLNVDLHNNVWNQAAHAAPGQPLETAPVSVLFRTVALVALTHREHQNAIADPIVNTPDILKVFPVNEILFPFSHHQNPFPDVNIVDAPVGRLDIIIAKKELGITHAINAQTPVTAQHFINFLQPNNNIQFFNQQGAQVNILQPNFANELNPAIIFADLNDIILRSNTGVRQNGAGSAVAGPRADLGNITFFDEVNAMHNVYKELVRMNIETVRNRYMLNNATIITATPNSKGATTIKITKIGNFGGVLIESWGKYNDDTRESSAFRRLAWTFNNALGNEQPGLLSVIEDAKILKDLYRLECIREPAALITNAMFLELATSNDNNGYRGFQNLYTFTSLTNRMPMAPEGTVDKCRNLWKKIIWGRRENVPIYYKYDYDIGGADIKGLTKLECNLLFNYICWKAGIPDLHNTTAGGNNIFPAIANRNRAAQIILLTAQQFQVNAGNPNVYEKRFILEGYPNNPNNPNNQVITAMNNRYTPDPNNLPDPGNPNNPINHNNREIRIEARFSENQATTLAPENITITQFPLELINQLMYKWYGVDIMLPNLPIAINLRIM